MLRKQQEWLPAVVAGNGTRNPEDLRVSKGGRHSLIPSIIPIAVGTVMALQAEGSGTLAVATALIGYGLASVRHMLPKARDVVLVTHACNSWLYHGTYEVKGSGLKVSMADPELRVIGKAAAYFDLQAGYVLRVVLYCAWKQQVHKVMLTIEPVKGAMPLKQVIAEVIAEVIEQVPDTSRLGVFEPHADVLQDAIKQYLEEAVDAAGQPAGASTATA